MGTELTRKVEMFSVMIDDTSLYIDDYANDATAGELASITQAIAEAKKTLDLVEKDLRAKTVAKLKDANLKTAVVVGLFGDQYTLEVVNKSQRSDVRRDELVSAVERIIADPQSRLNTQTGEMQSFEEACLSAIKKAFRLEPRWSELTALGINADEFCRTEWKSDIKIEKAVQL